MALLKGGRKKMILHHVTKGSLLFREEGGPSPLRPFKRKSKNRKSVNHLFLPRGKAYPSEAKDVKQFPLFLCRGGEGEKGKKGGASMSTLVYLFCGTERRGEKGGSPQN